MLLYYFIINLRKHKIKYTLNNISHGIVLLNIVLFIMYFVLFYFLFTYIDTNNSWLKVPGLY